MVNVHYSHHGCNWDVQMHSESQKYPRSFLDCNKPSSLRRDSSKVIGTSAHMDLSLEKSNFKGLGTPSKGNSLMTYQEISKSKMVNISLLLIGYKGMEINL